MADNGDDMFSVELDKHLVDSDDENDEKAMNSADARLYSEGRRQWPGYVRTHAFLARVRLPQRTGMTYWRESTRTHYLNGTRNVAEIRNNRTGQLEYFERLDSGNRGYYATSMSFVTQTPNGRRAPWFTGRYWHTDRNINNIN